MKHLLLRSLLVVLVYITHHAWSADTDAAPLFTVAIAPALNRPAVKSISLGDDNPKEFYVVLSNTSKEPQSIFEAWNSWGFAAVSFELRMPDGKMVVISRGVEFWTMNGPTTLTIPPGEHQVYVIHLDKKWVSRPELIQDWGAQIPIKLKAIFRVGVTPESTEHKVWTGRVESRFYDVTLEGRQAPK